MMKNLSKYGNITNDKNLLILTFLKGIKHITYLYLFKMIDGDNIKTSLNEAKTNLDSNEIIYKYWVSDNSNLTYHYMVQKYSNTKSNILSLDIKQASGIIVAFFENITWKIQIIWLNNIFFKFYFIDKTLYKINYKINN